MATHSSILAWRVPWKEEPGRLWPRGSQRVSGLKRLSMHVHFSWSNSFRFARDFPSFKNKSPTSSESL